MATLEALIKKMECPHCNKPGISAWSKFMAGTALPAKCKFCGEPSSIGGWILATVGAVFHLINMGAVLASLYYGTWWPLVTSIVIYVLFQICLVKWVPLTALSEERVEKGKMFLFAFLGIFVLIIIFYGLISS